MIQITRYNSKNAGIRSRGTSPCGTKQTYELTAYIGYDSNGRQIKKYKTVHVSGIIEARKARAAFITELEKGDYYTSNNVSLKDFAKNKYLKYVKENLSPASYELYEAILRNYLYDAIGHIPLNKINHTQINNYLTSLEKYNLSTSTIQKHYNLLSRLFNIAIENDVLTTNPMKKVKPITVVNKRGEVYTNEEIEKFIELLKSEENSQMALLLILAVTTGMRKGELLALEWKNIDFNFGTIKIEKSLSYTKTSGYQLREPKTNTSKRTISIPRSIMGLIKKHYDQKQKDRLHTKESWTNSHNFFVFSNAQGEPLFPTSPARYYERFCKRHNFKKIRFHDLRHTHVNFLMNKGATLNDVSKRLGHSSISITVDIYGHLDRSRDNKLASYFDDLF